MKLKKSERGCVLMELTQTIVKRIQDIQKERNISTNKLATLSGLKQSTVNDVVKGTSKAPRINTLLHICDGLNITLKEFFNNNIFENVRESKK